ncbi:MAG: tRNA (adenosine(37)-N6)-dimethylallyltransferase MiaA [Deltaproteobacteria bacterium]|nr:tRNA (adenosine(37)-N6)-dimethylallyltransferase MiaA [Deltaproteobacteria bacterium]
MVNRSPLVIVCGPTGSGKSRLGLRLAKSLGGEIISADSMQVYRKMDIGTDKPPLEVRREIRHHGIDLVDPDQPFDAAQYREAALRAVQAVTGSDKPAFVVGGTGLYLRALVHGLFRCPPIPEEVRADLRDKVRAAGPGSLYEELRLVDPVAAARIHPHDALRIIRALEVYKTLGRPISELWKDHGFSDRPFRALKLGIALERKELFRRIEARVDRMIERGLVEEVRGLLDQGYGRELRPMQSIGYRQIAAYLDKELPLERALELIKRDSRRYAKRQLTWFKHDPEVFWIPEEHLEKEALERVKKFLKV